jgi:DNA replication protein DnaC
MEMATMTTTTDSDTKTIHELLGAIGLHALVEALDDVLAQAITHRWSPVQVLEHVARLEQDARTRHSLERRLRRAKIGRFKPMADFEWDWPTKINREAIEAALRLDFLEDGSNVVLVAAQGMGKTMIAQNIAHAAVLAGHKARFISTADLLLDLASQDSARKLDLRLKHWASVPLLVLDELGYLSYDARNADLLFQVISRRYERRSLVLTTNMAFKEWPSIFPNSACTTALIDRIIHHASVITIKGKSYRLREAKADAMDDVPSSTERAKGKAKPKRKSRGRR